jgi:DUF4097 and DUF4098 domain-containing protein YvlB
MIVMACFAAQARAAEYTKSFTVSGRPSVHVDSNDGNVRVSTGDSNQVEFRVDYAGLTLDKNLHITATQQGDQLVLSARIVETRFFMLGNSRKLRIEVRMPKDGDVRIETGDGGINVANLSGDVDLRSGDGNLQVSALKGVVHMKTGDGAINGDGLDGKVDAVTGDGRVRLEGRFDALKVKTGDGSVEASAQTGSKVDSEWNIQTGDGRIEMTLPKDLQADVKASSGGGRVSSDIPLAVQGEFSKSSVHGKMNGGGAPLTIHTGDGSIHLRQG